MAAAELAEPIADSDGWFVWDTEPGHVTLINRQRVYVERGDEVRGVVENGRFVFIGHRKRVLQ